MAAQPQTIDSAGIDQVPRRRTTKFRRLDRFRHMPWWIRWVRLTIIRPERLKGGWLHWLFGSTLLQKECWSLKPGPVARGMAIGAFICWTPTLGIQIPLTVLFCILLKGNIPLGQLGTWISNPVTMVPLFTANLYLGCVLLDVPFPGFSSFRHLSAEQWAAFILNDFLLPMWVGSLMIGIPLAFVVYFGALGLSYRMRKLHLAESVKERTEKIRIRRMEWKAQRLERREEKIEALKERVDTLFDSQIARLERKKAKLEKKQNLVARKMERPRAEESPTTETVESDDE